MIPEIFYEDAALRDELRNICQNAPVFAGKTISHKTANLLGDLGYAQRNPDGDWTPTTRGLELNHLLTAERATA